MMGGFYPLPPQYGPDSAFGIKGKYWKACGFHTGVDFPCPVGTPIYAPEDGDIRYRDYGSAFGDRAFALSPDAPHEWWFAHCETRLPNGTRVKRGQQIGTTGNRGQSTAPHLHLEWHVGKDWDCSGMRDPMLYLDAPMKPYQWQFPNGHKVYAKYLKVDGHEQNADRVSNSIAALQEMLNRHSMPGGMTIPVTGKYWQQTDGEVRHCQRIHLPPADPEMKSFVGPKQWAHLKEATGCPYELVIETPPPPETTDRWVHGDAWRPAPSLVALRDEVDARWPDRSRVSDGTIGDAAHSTSKSEHNPVGHRFGPEYGTVGTVHALDITADGIDVQEVLDSVIGDPRVWYVIHNSSIWSKTHGWKKNPYNGSNPHTTHIHVSLAADDQASAVKHELDTEGWFWDVPPAPAGPEWFKEFLESNWAPILIIVVALLIVLSLFGLVG